MLKRVLISLVVIIKSVLTIAVDVQVAILFNFGCRAMGYTSVRLGSLTIKGPPGFVEVVKGAWSKVDGGTLRIGGSPISLGAMTVVYSRHSRYRFVTASYFSLDDEVVNSGADYISAFLVYYSFLRALSKEGVMSYCEEGRPRESDRLARRLTSEWLRFRAVESRVITAFER